jgi:hypothetical protein
MAQKADDKPDDKPEEKPGSGFVTVTLKKGHTHKGVWRPAGEKVEVTPARRDWLAKRGVI